MSVVPKTKAMTCGRPGRRSAAADPARNPEPSASAVGSRNRKLRNRRNPITSATASDTAPSVFISRLEDSVARYVWNGAPESAMPSMPMESAIRRGTSRGAFAASPVSSTAPSGRFGAKARKSIAKSVRK